MAPSQNGSVEGLTDKLITSMFTISWEVKKTDILHSTEKGDMYTTISLNDQILSSDKALKDIIDRCTREIAEHDEHVRYVQPGCSDALDESGGKPHITTIFKKCGPLSSYKSIKDMTNRYIYIEAIPPSRHLLRNLLRTSKSSEYVEVAISCFVSGFEKDVLHSMRDSVQAKFMEYLKSNKPLNEKGLNEVLSRL
ncbi:hypothetical protein ACLMJK_000536 [Lecanora helva]